MLDEREAEHAIVVVDHPTKLEHRLPVQGRVSATDKAHLDAGHPRVDRVHVNAYVLGSRAVELTGGWALELWRPPANGCGFGGPLEDVECKPIAHRRLGSRCPEAIIGEAMPTPRQTDGGG